MRLLKKKLRKIFFLVIYKNYPRILFAYLLRRVPFSRLFGYDRGLPIDRYYIEKFLQKNKINIQGIVLEVGSDFYSLKFGDDRVWLTDVLNVSGDNPRTTIIGDLGSGSNIPLDRFDCIILTQTLQFIFDFKSAVKHCYDALVPGGVLLVTVPGITQISRYDMDHWGEYWRFTSLSISRVFSDVFGEDRINTETFGNVLSSSAFLYGLSSKDLRISDLEYNDCDYELIITVKATKPII